MVPKDIVDAFDEIRNAARNAARIELEEAGPLAPQCITIAEGVVGALFSIAKSLERKADALERIAERAEPIAKALESIARH